KTADEIERVKADYGASLLDPAKAGRLSWVMHRSFQFWSRRLGALSGLKLFRHTQSAQTLLLPAVDGVLKAAPLLWAEAPAVLEGIDVDGLRRKRMRLGDLRVTIDQVQEFHQ